MATPLTATPIPAYTAVPDVPADLNAAIANLEKFAIPRFATVTLRDSTITAPTQGQMAYTNDAGLWNYTGTAWVLVPNNNQAARGVVYIAKGGQNSTYAAQTELAAVRFTGLNLEAGRHYRVLYTQLSADGDAGGGATYNSLSAMDLRLRIAAGTTAGITGTQVATVRVPVFGDDSGRSSGINAMGTFTVASTGAYSIAACIITVGAVGNGSRLLGVSVITVEDIGPAITEGTGTALF
jgi:hypothetical protein